jgi:hypothetical protein
VRGNSYGIPQIWKKEIDLLVKARLLYLREDFKDATEEQFSEIEKISTVTLKSILKMIYLPLVQRKTVKLYPLHCFS